MQCCTSSVLTSYSSRMKAEPSWLIPQKPTGNLELLFVVDIPRVPRF